MKIVDIDRGMTSPEDGMQERFLKLDSIPTQEWGNLFEAIHKQDTDMQKRRVYVRNEWLVVTCPLEEIQRQVKTLNRLCTLTDEELKKIQQQRAAAKEAASEEQARRNKIGNDIFDNLNFD